MRVVLSNSIIGISRGYTTVICNAECKCIEITSNNESFTIYPETKRDLKNDYKKLAKILTSKKD